MTVKMELHPLCTLFPRMVGKEFAALIEDIRAHGLREPIVTYQGMILDGGNRYNACLHAGVDPHTVEYAGTNLAAYVLSANLHRRHMSAGQQAAIVASAADWAKAQKRGGDGSNQHRKKEQIANVSGLLTVADRQAQSGASSATQRAADQVAKADPELAIAVGHGEITLAKAKEKVTGKPRKPRKAAAKPEPELDHDNRLASAIELVDELQAENLQLQARIEALIISDLAKKVDELVRANAHATKEKGVEMDKNARLIKERDALQRFQSAVVSASGAGDPKAALLWVKAMAATQRTAA